VSMKFIIFMVVFALFLAFSLWQVFKPGKRKPAKKLKRQAKKLPPSKKVAASASDPSKPKSVLSNAEVRRIIATELFKRNPDVVTHVVKQWLKEK
jgi:flagellar biosynthesis/type III secretory pathway M-ring protein FliF/YscJ